MNILIKGMEMPKNCDECPCRTIGYTKDYCNVLGKFIDCVVGSDGRQEDCPLVEVPPHGRLIDADALDVIGYCDIPQGREDTFDDGVMWLAEQIDLLPTIIPAEEGK